MRSLLLLFSLLICQFTLAQRNTIDISHLELTVPFSFNVDRVIDARINTETLGYVYNKKARSYTTLFPTSSVDSSMTALFQSKNNTSEEHLILRLNRLFLYQTTIQGARHLSAEVSITFIVQNDRDYLEQFTSTKTIREEARDGIDLSEILLQEALDSCLLHYEKRKQAGIFSNKLLAREDLNTRFTDNEATVKNMPYHIRGLFYTFYDFRDYSIDTKTPFSIAVVKSELHEPRQVKLKFDDRSMRKKEIFAFSNGKNLFVKTGKYYTEVTDTSGEFWLNRYEEFSTTTTEYNAGIVAAGVMGGLVGVGIYAAITKKPLANKYILDFERGAVVPADYPDPGMVTSQILFYGSGFLSNNDTITLSIGNQKPIKLGRDQYYIYESDDRCLPVNVRLDWGDREYYDRISPMLLNTAVARCQVISGKVGIEMLDIGEQNKVKEAIENGLAKEVIQ